MKAESKKKTKHREIKVKNNKTSKKAKNKDDTELDEQHIVGGWIVEKRSKTNKFAAAAFFLLLLGVTLGRFNNSKKILFKPNYQRLLFRSSFRYLKSCTISYSSG